MNVLSGKMMVQKNPGALREIKFKVDFDKTAHLSQKKITQRKLQRAVLEKNPPEKVSENANDWIEIPCTTKVSETFEKINEEDRDQSIRFEKRKKIVIFFCVFF